MSLLERTGFAKEVAESELSQGQETMDMGINSSGSLGQSLPWDANIRYKAKNLTRTIQAGIDF